MTPALWTTAHECQTLDWYSKLKGDLRVLLPIFTSRDQNQASKLKERPIDHWASRLSVPSQFCRSLEAESLCEGGLIREGWS